MSEDNVLTDGREAERLMNDPTLLKVLQKIENDAVESWKIATTKEKREEHHADIRAVARLRNKFDELKGNKATFEAEERRFGRQKKGTN